MIILSLCMSSESYSPCGDTYPLSEDGRGRSWGEEESYLCRIWVPTVTCKPACKIDAMPKLYIHIHSLGPHNVFWGLIELLFYSTI